MGRLLRSSIIDYQLTRGPSFFHTSIRAKIREEVDGYSASADFWIRCLYQGEKGDSADVEKGFLKGQLLVKVLTVAFSTTLQNY